MAERPEVIPERLKFYNDWNYCSWFFEALSDRPPLARQGEIGEDSFEDMYLDGCYDIAHDMADDWPGYNVADLAFFFLKYKKMESGSLYSYKFQIGASGSYEQFRGLRKVVDKSLSGEKGLEVEVGFGRFAARIVLPSRESQEIEFNFEYLCNRNRFRNLDYEILKQELDALVS